MANEITLEAIFNIIYKKEIIMKPEETKTYDDYLQEAKSVSIEQLQAMSADWRVPNEDDFVDMRKWANPSIESIKYFAGR
jgi:hypothetical protein